MKVLHSEASPGWGGQEIRILREMEGMRARGHDLYLVAALHSPLAQKAKKQGFPVLEVCFEKRFWWKTLFQLIRWIKQKKIELLNTHSSLDSWIGGIAARICRISIVRTRHLSTPVRKGWNSRILYGFLADFIVTTCEQMVAPLAEQSGKARERCQSIPTGIDPEQFQIDSREIQCFRKSLGILPHQFLVGTVCFMRSWKGLQDFIQAAQELSSEKDIHWVIIGGGHEAAYRDMVASLHLSNFHFTGHLSNPLPAIAALQAFALLSTAHEGVSQASLQAAYLQKPLITTNVGGLGEVCIDGVTGIQVPVFSAPKVAQAVLTLKNHPELKSFYGIRAKALVCDKFIWEQTLENMEKVYETQSLNRARRHRFHDGAGYEDDG